MFENLNDGIKAYVESNVKMPRFNQDTRHWVIRYQENGVWNIAEASTPSEANNIYNQLVLAKKTEYIISKK